MEPTYITNSLEICESLDNSWNLSYDNIIYILQKSYYNIIYYYNIINIYIQQMHCIKVFKQHRWQ